MRRGWVWILFMGLLGAFPCWAQAPLPLQLVPAEVATLQAEKEVLSHRWGGLLVTPMEERRATDKDGNLYHNACYVYAAERRREGETEKVVRYTRRFLIRLPDREMLPLAKRVGRALVLFQALNRERLKRDHAHDVPVVEVWLTRRPPPGQRPDVGGEQFRNQIYLYEVTAERSPNEWLREVAHEYGHYALPGISGFTDPEAWANGVLGERLFPLWLQQEWRAGRLRAEEIPWVTPEPLQAYQQTHITPHLRATLLAGANASLLAKRDADSMNAYTGLVLALESVYGSALLREAIASTTPRTTDALIEATDFLRGTLEALNTASELSIALVSLSPHGEATEKVVQRVYLPVGEWEVETEGMVGRWLLEAPNGKAPLRTSNPLRVTQAGWYLLTANREGGKTATLHLRRRTPARRTAP